MTQKAEVKLDQPLFFRLKSLAIAKGDATERLVQLAVTEFLEREERAALEKVEDDARYRRFKETGLHATHQDVKTWMESWGTENELPLPKCRSL